MLSQEGENKVFKNYKMGYFTNFVQKTSAKIKFKKMHLIFKTKIWVYKFLKNMLF
jgi:hypothetical protein